MTCERCDFVKSCPKISKHLTRYHVKYHSKISRLWWEPLFWLLTTRDFLFWYACHKYGGGREWRGWKSLKGDWQLAVDLRKWMWGCDD